MKRAIAVLVILVGYQQYQIHELKLDHEDAGAYIDTVADMVAECKAAKENER